MQFFYVRTSYFESPHACNVSRQGLTWSGMCVCPKIKVWIEDRRANSINNGVGKNRWRPCKLQFEKHWSLLKSKLCECLQTFKINWHENSETESLMKPTRSSPHFPYKTLIFVAFVALKSLAPICFRIHIFSG